MYSSKKNTYLSPQHTPEPAAFPSISQPKILGCFSLNEHRQYIPDARNCKYIYKRYQSDRIDYDLNDGIEYVIRKPDSAKAEKINHLLEFIINNKYKLHRNQVADSHEDGILFPDIVCFRGLLRVIMCSPYEQRDPWIILATKYKGTIYLCAEETQKQAQDRINMTDSTKRILSYGFKFEQFILSDGPDVKPSTNVPVNECEEFCCIFSTKLNGQRILYGAEMDGIDSSETLDLNSVNLNLCKFIELKVKLQERNHRQEQNYFRFKLRNWWCQCFLVNIKEIIVGTRNENGIVRQVSTMTVKDIPKQCQNFWTPSVCMEFCSQFLKLVAREMQGVDSPYDVFRFEFDPTNSDHIFMKKYPKPNEHSFLPKWYIEHIEAMTHT